MTSPEFGADAMDRYSTPLKKEPTRLGTLFTMPVRERPEKPGRALAVAWDARVPLVEGFDNRYSYFVTFAEKGSHAGNHYHQKKQELFFPMIGDFTVVLENPTTKEREEISLKTTEHTTLFVPAGTAHVVRAESETAILLVIATSPNIDGDEFEYHVL